MSKIFFDILFLGQQSNKSCNNKQNNLSQDFLQEARNGILLSKLFWPTVRKNCSSDREKILKFEAEGREFAKILRSLNK